MSVNRWRPRSLRRWDSMGRTWTRSSRISWRWDTGFPLYFAWGDYLLSAGTLLKKHHEREKDQPNIVLSIFGCCLLGENPLGTWVPPFYGCPCCCCLYWWGGACKKGKGCLCRENPRGIGVFHVSVEELPLLSLTYTDDANRYGY